MQVDKIVYHEKFGQGKIKKVKKDSIMVVFNSGKTVKLKLNYCIENRLLRIAK